MFAFIVLITFFPPLSLTFSSAGFLNSSTSGHRYYHDQEEPGLAFAEGAFGESANDVEGAAEGSAESRSADFCIASLSSGF